MDVRIFPNLRRPGIGRRPNRDGQRPNLPQHARHCPVLEAGSMLGYLVHAPLAEGEAFRVGYDGDGRYTLDYSVNPAGARWDAIFGISFQLPINGLGASREDVTLNIQATPDSRETARLMTRMFIVPDDLGTPAGAVTLRGAWDFATPPGWDTVYTPILNMIERPVAPGLSIRVETDWYAHDTEFRYVLQPGESLSVAHSVPIGQVFFVPREDVVLRDGTEDDARRRREAATDFFSQKHAAKVTTPYGLEYSPHYLRTSRRRQDETAAGVSADARDRSDAPVPAVGSGN